VRRAKIIIDNGIAAVVPIIRLRNRLRNEHKQLCPFHDDKRWLYPL